MEKLKTKYRTGAVTASEQAERYSREIVEFQEVKEIYWVSFCICKVLRSEFSKFRILKDSKLHVDINNNNNNNNTQLITGHMSVGNKINYQETESQVQK